MTSLANLDLLTVGIAVAAIGVMGFAVYFNNNRSVTNRAFVVLALTAIVWSICNYISYQVQDDTHVLWLFRSVIFSAVWFALALHVFLYVFPRTEVKFPKYIKYVLLPVSALTAALTLTPFAFEGVKVPAQVGNVAVLEIGPAMLLFGFLALSLNIGGFYLLLRKTLKLKGLEARQSRDVLIGIIITFSLILIFNFILPVVFDVVRFIPFGAFFILPFIAFTAYTIIRHKLFDLKVIGVSSLAFGLTILTFLEVIFSHDPKQILFRGSVFLLVLIIGILLIRGVLREVRQREHIQKLAVELEKANERLKALDRLKDEFLSFATHQIRAPLTAIKGYSSLILEGDYGQVSDGVKDAADKILTSSSGMSVMVDNFLNISKIEQGVKFELAPLDLAKMADQAAGELLPNIERKGLHLERKIAPDDSCKVMADTGWLKQVIVNLIDNSIKYTEHGGIRVIVERVGEKVRFVVKDTGAGMSPETIGKLFQKFSRSSGAKLANAGGSGIGLYLAKLIVEGHKGRVWAESEGTGKGSQFIVELPASV